MPRLKMESDDHSLDSGFWAAGPNSHIRFTDVVQQDSEGMWLHPDEVKKLVHTTVTDDVKPSSNNETKSVKPTVTTGKRKVEQNNAVSTFKKRKSESLPTKNDYKAQVTTQMKTEEASCSTIIKPVNVNVETQRDEFESNSEWNLRCKFLKAHVDSFPLDRLVCLSRCFINNEIYCCSYPAAVMQLLKTMRLTIADEIVEQKERLKSKYEVSFVKAEAETDPKTKCHNLYSDEKTMPNKGIINFVKAGSDYQSLDYSKTEQGNDKDSQTYHPGEVPCMKAEEAIINLDGKPQEYDSLYDKMHSRMIITQREEKFHTMVAELKKITESKKESNPISKLYEAAQKVKLVPHSKTDGAADGLGFECQVYVADIFLAKSFAKNKKGARNNAHELAITELLKPFLKLIGTHAEKLTLCASDEPFDNVENTTNSKDETYNASKIDSKVEDTDNSNSQSNLQPPTEKMQPRPKNINELKSIKRNLPRFFLRELNAETFNNPMGCIRQSCDFLKAFIQFKSLNWTNGQVKSTLTIERLVLAEGVANSTKAAEQEAAAIALEKLRDVCWTIHFKGETDCDADTKTSKDSLMDRKEVMTEEFEHGKKLSDSNIGSKLMKKMGWNGRGIGKNQQGREDPVLVKQIVHRSGLGTLNNNSAKEFETVVKKIVTDYYCSYQDTDLAFAPDFSNVERKVIHDACRQFGLKSKSYGSGDERYLVVSRQRTPHELFEYVRSKGGETHKYKLIPPRIDRFK